MENKTCFLNKGVFIETYGNINHSCIILIHGLGCQLIQWPKSLIEGLVSKQFYVVTFDNRDSGYSQHYTHLGAPNLMAAIKTRQEGNDFKPPYTLEDMASDVVKLMDSISIQKATILGVSMGGMIAQVLALNYQSRLSSLILIETSSGDLPPGLFSPPENTNETLETYVESKTQLYRIYNPHFFNEENTRALHAAAFNRAYNPDGSSRQLLAIIASQPRGERLRQLQVKSLIIHGAEDPVFSKEHGEFLKDCIPSSQLKIIEKMGHGLPEELCGEIVEVISDFIKT